MPLNAGSTVAYISVKHHLNKNLLRLTWKNTGSYSRVLTVVKPFFSADHYRLIAYNYDFFYQPKNETLMDLLWKYVDDVKPDHVVADIGSGTGFFAEKIFEARHLKNPIWCVDPSPVMQILAKERKGVYPVKKTAGEFLDNLEINQVFDMVLCICSMHHFTQPMKFLRGLKAHLRTGGALLVVTTGLPTSFPFFTKAENAFGKITFSKERVTAMLRDANFQVEVSEEKFLLGMEKSRWYKMLRGRFQSSMSEFTDKEIEDGIDELEEGKLKGLSLHDDVQIHYSFMVFRAT